MRILIATAHRGTVGGAETYLRAVLPKLRDRGHDLALLCELPAGGAAIDDDCPGLPILTPADMASQRPDVCLIHGLIDPALEADLVESLPVGAVRAQLPRHLRQRVQAVRLPDPASVFQAVRPELPRCITPAAVAG